MWPLNGTCNNNNNNNNDNDNNSLAAPTDLQEADVAPVFRSRQHGVRVGGALGRRQHAAGSAV